MLFTKKLSNKIGKRSFDTAAKVGLNALKTDSKKVVHKVAEATGELIGDVQETHCIKVCNRKIDRSK